MQIYLIYRLSHFHPFLGIKQNRGQASIKLNVKRLHANIRPEDAFAELPRSLHDSYRNLNLLLTEQISKSVHIRNAATQG